MASQFLVYVVPILLSQASDMNPPTASFPTATAFERGDYASVALHGSVDDWRTYAAYGLIGRSKDAIVGLARFHQLEAQFYRAVAYWIDGDDASATRGLEGLALPHAQNLLRLVRREKIRVLSQCDRGNSGSLVSSIQEDPRFEVINFGFHPDDQPNKAYADVRSFFDSDEAPDFYISKMLEWHLLPPNLQSLPCPIFGHTGDYDLHIQTVRPWLGVFDELLTTDQTEWRDVSQLTRSPVSVFPKAFGLAVGSSLPAIADRPLDTFISGTTQHPYHPDKARLLNQILRQKDLRVKMIEGFLDTSDYLKILGSTRAAFTYIRHAGAMPTRGMESLAMGAAIAVQKESILRAYLGEEDGVVPYSAQDGDLPDVLRRISREWESFGLRAMKGAETIRTEFKASRAASQYFRFLTFLAAKPRGLRERVDPALLRQKRSILVKGWAWRPAINRAIRQRSIKEWMGDLGELPTPEPLIDSIRELVLEYATALQVTRNFNVRLEVDRKLLASALELSRAGIQRFPACLVLRFNAIRTGLHFGEPQEVSDALRLARETLARPTGSWQVSAREDVFPYDFFGQFFNYREYLDLCTRAAQGEEEVSGEFPRLILASIAYYASWYRASAGEEEAESLSIRSLALRSIRLDPAFPFYSFHAARLLLEDTGAAGVDRAADDQQATELLIELADTSMLNLPASRLLEILHGAGRSAHPRIGELIEKAATTEARVHRTNIGSDDWESVPLRSALAADPVQPGPSVVSQTGPAASGTRVLYLCLEFAHWHHAKRLAYPAGLGMEEGFRAQGVEVVTLPSICGLSTEAREAWQRHVRTLCEGRAFDQVWVELVHSEWDEPFWKWIQGIAPVRVGLVMESLHYEPEVYLQAPSLLQRHDHVERRLGYVTHALCVDEADVVELNQRRTVLALWWPQAVPSRFILPPPSAAPDSRAIFSGAIYGARNEWLTHPQLGGRLTFQTRPGEEATDYPALFDEAHRLFEAHLCDGGPMSWALLAVHTETWRRIRIACFELWLRGLQGGGAVVNLPSYMRSYAGRVFEGIAAGRPVISWAVNDRPETAKLFAEGSEILLFSKEDPASLVRHLDRLEADPLLGPALAKKAQTRLRCAHTLERRVGQILQWIASGATPEWANPLGFTPVAEPPQYLSELLVNSQDASPMLLTLGRVRAAQGAEGSALECLARAADLRPMDPAMHSARAKVALAVEDWESARSAVDTIIGNDPRSIPGLELLVTMARTLGHHDLAKKGASLLMRHSVEELSSFVQFAAAAMRYSGSTTSRSPISEDRAWLDATMTRVIEAFSQNSQEAIDSGRRQVAALGDLSSARLRYESQDLSAAWAATLEAIRTRPFHPEGWLLLGQIALKVGDSILARRCADRARQLVPRWKRAKQFLHALPQRASQSKVQTLELPDWAGDEGRAPRLSVCLITKNEQRYIAQCLKSIRDVADQIVVVDTGSSDRTIEIAKELGAEVHRFDWCDDFSSARNAGLEHARGDWILVIDADEELDASSHDLLRKAIRTAGVIAWRLPLNDAGKDKEGSHYVPRLFRNVPGAHFVGRIHEHAFGSLQTLQQEWGLENRLGEPRLIHHGYTAQVVKDRSKVQRNLRLLDRAIEEQPDDVGLRMSYGLDLVRSQQLDAGLEEYTKAFKLMAAQPASAVPPELRERLLTLMTTHLMTAQRFQSVVELSESPQALATGPTASLHLMFAVACYVQRKFVQSAQHLKSCIAKRNQQSLSPIHTDIHTGGPRHLLALCYVKLDKAEAAEKEYRASLEEEPSSAKVRLDFAHFLEDSGRSVPALEELHRVISTNPAEQSAWRYGAEIALRSSDFLDFAADWTLEALRHFPRDPALGCARAEVLLLRGALVESAVLWQQFQDVTKPAHLAAIILCETAVGYTSRPLLELEERVISQEFCVWFRRLLSSGAEPTIRQIVDRLPELQQVLPSAASALRAVMDEAHAA